MFVPIDTKKFWRAVQRNDLKRVKFFIATEDVPPTITDPLQQTIAHIATRNGYFDMLVYIVKKAPSLLRSVDSDGYSILHLAIEEGEFNMVRHLVDNYNLDLHEQSKHGWGTAIHIAVEFDRLDILRYFIDEKKGDVNVLGKLENLPPVFLAVRYQYRDIIDYLVVEKKADLTIIDSNRENILYVMLRKNDLHSMKHLLDESRLDFNINQQNYLGETLVHVAIILNRTDILKYLVDEKQADVNLPRKRDGMTPLHCAAEGNRYEICQYLVERGANIQFKDASEQLAGQKASDTRLIEYLEKVAQARSRRSVQHSPFPLLWSIGCVRERDGINCLEGIRSHDDQAAQFHSFHSFLVVAQLILAAYVSHRSEHRTVVSPRVILLKKMDPLAIDTVRNIPDFLK